jgi:hypothetical protein
MKNTTLLACVSADGVQVPSLLLWPQKSLPAEILPLQSPNLIIHPQDSGYIDKSLFDWYVRHTLVPFIQKRRELLQCPFSPVLLLLDSHSTRHDATLWRELRSINILVLTFPSHTTSVLQPLDLSVFGAFKSSLRANLDVPTERGIAVQRQSLVDAIKYAHGTAFLPHVIEAGFQKSGIYPLDPSFVLEHLPMTSPYIHPSKAPKTRHTIDISGKEITDFTFLDEWDHFLSSK